MGICPPTPSNYKHLHSMADSNGREPNEVSNTYTNCARLSQRGFPNDTRALHEVLDNAMEVVYPRSLESVKQAKRRLSAPGLPSPTELTSLRSKRVTAERSEAAPSVLRSSAFRGARDAPKPWRGPRYANDLRGDRYSAGCTPTRRTPAAYWIGVPRAKWLTFGARSCILYM